MKFPARPSGRVVVTGMGAVTPLGHSIAEYWPRLLAGDSGVGPITVLDAADYPTRIAAEVKDWDPTKWMEGKDARRIDRFLAFSVAASRMALEDAKFPDLSREEREQVGVLIGSGIGGLTTMSEQSRKLWMDGPSRVSPFLVPYMIPDMASGYVSIQEGFLGPNFCAVSACATGADSIGIAADMIRLGHAAVMVAGGAEAPINPIGLAGFCSARAMTTNNDRGPRASRPFDKERDGFVMSEGAGILILEDLEFALSRGANIIAEIVGYGGTADAHHITAPDPEGDGAARAMKKALKRAGLKPEDIQYLNAHGTSTPLNDKGETLAIKTAFGDHAYKMAVSSTKSALGHMLGAAGAVESINCILAIRDGVAPPTINYETPDPDCDLDYVPNAGRKMEIRYAQNNAFGFGGHNTSLIFGRYQS